MTLFKNGSVNSLPERRFHKQLEVVFQPIAFGVVEHSTVSCLHLWVNGGHCERCDGGVDGRKENKCVLFARFGQTLLKAVS